jgi:hypothetical protein
MMYAYLLRHHSAGPQGPFQTVSVAIRRYVPAGGSQMWRGHIRAPFQIKRAGLDWQNVYREPIPPAWASSSAPRMYALVEGKRLAVQVRT